MTTQRLLVLVAALLLSCSLARLAWAGPTWIAVEAPAIPWPSHGKDSVALLVHLRGHVDEQTRVVATAEGWVDGRRETLPVQLEPTDDPTVFAVTPNWPRRGRWAVVVRGSGHMDSYAIIDFGAHGLSRRRVNGHAVWQLDDVDIHSAVGTITEAQIAGALKQTGAPGGRGPVGGGSSTGGAGAAWPGAAVVGLLATGVILLTASRRRTPRTPQPSNAPG